MAWPTPQLQLSYADGRSHASDWYREELICFSWARESPIAEIGNNSPGSRCLRFFILVCVVTLMEIETSGIGAGFV